ncbi:pyridoxal phosphate-dependent decarboxylase family protein [Shimia aestuarii]|uniref:Aromatic-L-amino-acid decarboxylase n=1 Tax=Shimia aestuarii TaxID=254406 RepID=A0A1I4IC25_9RHOB|nr:pyridoxal-dependent decarboxylase [Shimia aestuarii]SFL51910.1 aromatic-L-amino-acid decarboxylase [Shimia aestuarii]
MQWSEFSRWGAKISDWARGYHETLRERPVRAQVAPGDVLNALPATPPTVGEDMDAIFADFEKTVMPGITHWQHPRFFAYFPANATPPSMLADYLTSVIAPQCMLWQTSPAATEMETRMIDWLRQSIGLPDGFSGVIQDSASSATLAAVLTMRERALNWQGNEKGLAGLSTLRIYCSAEVHTSVDRAIWVSGIGQDNLVRIPTQGPTRAMDPAALDAAIKADIAAGLTPAGIIACTGGTGTGACDDITATCDVAEAHGLYLHVDAAWAGAAMICPEYRTLWTGVERADSVVFNPHKWLGVQFDCSAHFLRNPDDLVRTLAIQPEYLKTHGKDGIINYSEWSVPLGRRFRALKIWFVLRSYGLNGLQEMIRNHVTWAEELCTAIRALPDFEIITDPVLSLFTFRYVPDGTTDPDRLNQTLVDRINDDGRIYLTQTRVNGNLVIRFQAGQVNATREDILFALEVIQEISAELT